MSWAWIVVLALLASEGRMHPDLPAAVQVWPAQERPVALAYAYCESRGDTTARNGLHSGVWQMNEVLHGTVSDDVFAQADQAYRLYEAEGWGHWEPSCWAVSLIGRLGE